MGSISESTVCSAMIVGLVAMGYMGMYAGGRVRGSNAVCIMLSACADVVMWRLGFGSVVFGMST